jgi:hypothetical protein
VLVDHGSLSFFSGALYLPWATSLPACDGQGQIMMIAPPQNDGQLWVCRSKANNTLEWVRVF